MLDVEVLREHLAGLSYRPDWTFRISQGAYEGLQLVIDARVEDSYAPGQVVPLDIHVPLPPFESLRQFDTWLSWRLGQIERHESLEWLRRDGKPIFDPHRPHADRDEPI